MNQRLNELYRNGWVEIGYSSWSGDEDDIQDDVIKKAKAIKACLVAIYKKQVGTQIEEMPMDYGMSPYWWGGYYGGFTTYAPYTVAIYQYDLVFLVQMENFYTGLYVTDLDDISRKLVNSNKGVLVRIVVNDSPAYNADIIPNDIITQIGKFKLTNVASFNRATQFYQGQNVIFLINRAGKQLSKIINIGKVDYQNNYYKNDEI